MLRDRGVKVPSAIVTDKLGKCSWVTVLLAELVVDTVFATKMKDVYRQSALEEPWPILGGQLETTVVVKNDMLWAVARSICPFDKVLVRISRTI